MAVHYQAIGPLMAGEGSRAFLGLEVFDDGRAYPVVLVWLPEGAEGDKALFNKIRRETEHAAKLDHPNIVHVHGFGTLDEGHARVVEFADGETLRKVVERAEKIPPLMAAKIVCDAATGVHYAHVAGNDDGTPLIHGDVRPETLLISFAGVVKVTGYGALAFAPREMGGQRVKGRRVHTAPEQIIGGRESFSLQTDVYLLGVTLYEAITGQVPFADQGDFFDHAVLTLPLPPIQPGLCPPELEAVIQKACTKKVNERYPTPLALREAIEAALGTLPTNDELAAYLKQLFPGSDEARAARKLTIDAAIAEAARRLWGDRKRAAEAPPPAAPPAPAPAPVAGVPAPATAAPPKADRKAPEPGIKITYQAPPEKERAGPRLPWALIVTGLAIAAAVAWWITQGDQQLPATREGLAALDAGVAVKPAGGADAAVALEDAGAAELTDTALPAVVAGSFPVDGGAVPLDAGAARVDAGAVRVATDADGADVLVAPPAPKPAPTLLQLEVNPPCEVTIDGRIEGRTPVKLELAAGKHLVKLENPELGINTVRTVTLKEAATAFENISIGTGTVVLSAPDGAAIFMDGKRIGVAPMKEIRVYEGSHRLLVTVGRAKWSEPFSIHSGENIRFNVELE